MRERAGGGTKGEMAAYSRWTSKLSLTDTIKSIMQPRPSHATHTLSSSSLAKFNYHLSPVTGSIGLTGIHIPTAVAAGYTRKHIRGREMVLQVTQPVALTHYNSKSVCSRYSIFSVILAG